MIREAHTRLVNVTGGLQLLCGGFGAGIAMAAPLGPVAALCVSATLKRGRAHGMIAGLGAALGDTLLACIAAFGFASTSSALAGHEGAIRLSTGALLAIMGIRRLVLSAPRPPTRPPFGRAFLAPLVLTVCNPATLLCFVALLGALAPTAAGRPGGPLLVTAGVFAGAVTWWTVLTLVASRLGARIGPATLLRIDRGVSVVVLLSGLVLIGTGLSQIVGWS